MDNDIGAQRYWSHGIGQLIAALATSRSGLSGKEANARLEACGMNTVAVSQTMTATRLLLRQFESPLVLILVLGAVVALALKEWTDATIILLIVAGSTLLAFTQEYRASAAMARLRKRLALRVASLRDGTVQSIEARHVVPGDVVRLSAGNLVPADGVILARLSQCAPAARNTTLSGINNGADWTFILRTRKRTAGCARGRAHARGSRREPCETTVQQERKGKSAVPCDV